MREGVCLLKRILRNSTDPYCNPEVEHLYKKNRKERCRHCCYWVSKRDWNIISLEEELPSTNNIIEKPKKLY